MKILTCWKNPNAQLYKVKRVSINILNKDSIFVYIVSLHLLFVQIKPIKNVNFSKKNCCCTHKH